MTISAVCYCTREHVKAALDVAETARVNDRVDRAIEAARETVDGALRRRFAPTVATRYFSWPSDRSPTSWRLWLNDSDLISVTTLTAGGTVIAAADYFLEPVNSGPPYRSIEIDLSSTAAFVAGATSQQTIVVSGLFGYTDVAATVGTLSGSLAATASVSPTITWSDLTDVGIGTLLQVDSERMLITGRSMTDTTQDVGGSGLTANNTSVSLTVSDGTAFDVEQVLLVDSERLRVVDIAGNTLTVRRAQDGSVLAAHSASTSIYALTGVTVMRAAQGSTLAAHNSGATVTRWVPPPLVRDLAIGYALTQLLQESAGYARTAGSGDNLREVLGRGLAMIEQDAIDRHGRQFLIGTV